MMDAVRKRRTRVSSDQPFSLHGCSSADHILFLTPKLVRCVAVHAQDMQILSRRLYNGGFNHLRRRTGSLLLGVPRPDLQSLQVRLMCMARQDIEVNVRPFLLLSVVTRPRGVGLAPLRSCFPPLTSSSCFSRRHLLAFTPEMAVSGFMRYS